MGKCCFRQSPFFFGRMLIITIWILTQAKTTSVKHPYMSKEDRLEAGRARLRIAKEVSDVSPTSIFEANLTMLILSAHTGLFASVDHLPHGRSGWSASDQPLHFSKWRSPIPITFQHLLSSLLHDHRSNIHPSDESDHHPATPSASP